MKNQPVPYDDALYDWLIHYNIYDKLFVAIPREKYNEYCNNYNTEGVFRSKSVNTILEILHKTKGNPQDLKV